MWGPTGKQFLEGSRRPSIRGAQATGGVRQHRPHSGLEELVLALPAGTDRRVRRHKPDAPWTL
jgi:hypothetical protein